MEINKKIFLAALSQVKAHKDVIVLRDSETDGCVDIFYGPKCRESMPRCANRMTVSAGGSGADLFDDAPVGKLGRPVPVFLSRVKEALRGARSCVLQDGRVNGIRVEVEESGLLAGRAEADFIIALYERYSEEVKNAAGFETVLLRKADYAYAVSECAKFVSDDPSRYFMQGMCFDFVSGGKDAVHIAATDGRKLCLLKQAASHKEYPADTDDGRFIVFPAYLHIPGSDYSAAEIRLCGRYGRVLIAAEDYRFDGVFECAEGRFPNYMRVIPAVTEKTQWFTLCAASFRRTAASVKSMMAGNDVIYLNAENPESLSIAVADGRQAAEVEGTASRPMRLSFKWEHLSACLFDGLALTKFLLDGADKAFLAHTGKAGKGVTLDVTKLFMPTNDENSYDRNMVDAFRIPSGKEPRPEDNASEDERDAD